MRRAAAVRNRWWALTDSCRLSRRRHNHPNDARYMHRMRLLLALLVMTTTVHPANLKGTWRRKEGTLTIGTVLKHTNGAQNSYPAKWSADGTYTPCPLALSGRDAILPPRHRMSIHTQRQPPQT
jgi:hypothetical protein